MRVTVLVPEQEVTVDLSAEEIIEAIFALKTEDRITRVLNEIAGVLGRISDEQICTQLSIKQRQIIHEFLTKQAARYALEAQS